MCMRACVYNLRTHLSSSFFFINDAFFPRRINYTCINAFVAELLDEWVNDWTFHLKFLGYYKRLICHRLSRSRSVRRSIDRSEYIFFPKINLRDFASRNDTSIRPFNSIFISRFSSNLGTNNNKLTVFRRINLFEGYLFRGWKYYSTEI